MPHTIREGYKKGSARDIVLEEDLLNRRVEDSQVPSSTVEAYYYQGIDYQVKHHNPSTLRTYIDEDSRVVRYPHIIFVHGVASDLSYFDNLCEDLSRLGLSSSVIELPRLGQIFIDENELLDWQIGAVLNIYEQLKTADSSRKIILSGHSRGGMLVIMAAEYLNEIEAESFYETVAAKFDPIDTLDLIDMTSGEMYDLAPDVFHNYQYDGPSGLIPLATAGLRKIGDGKLYKGLPMLLPLFLNNLASIKNKNNRFKQNALMVGRVILKNIPQTLVEVKQAMDNDVSDSLAKMPDVDIFIPFAKKDEFINYKDLYELVLTNPNVSAVTVDSAHMLDKINHDEIISEADPLTLTGQILQFCQYKAEGYSPKSFHPASGSLYRLSNFNLQQYMK